MIEHVSFDLNLSSGNDAIVTDPGSALRALLLKLADDVQFTIEDDQDDFTFYLRDKNGNKVGDATLTITHKED